MLWTLPSASSSMTPGILVVYRGVEVSGGLELQVERSDRRRVTKPNAKAPIAASSMGFSRAFWAAWSAADTRLSGDVSFAFAWRSFLLWRRSSFFLVT
jgi:hypothetical protein